MFFSIDETARLTGLKVDRLRYLAKLDVITPHKIAPEGLIRKLARYSWDQLLELRALASLPQNTSVKKLKALQSFLKDHRGDSRLATADILIIGEDQFYLIEDSDNMGKILISCLGHTKGQLALEFILIPNPEIAIKKSNVLQFNQDSDIAKTA